MKHILIIVMFLLCIGSIFLRYKYETEWRCDCDVDTAAMNAYADSLLRVHWTEVCRDSMNKWDSINKLYER